MTPPRRPNLRLVHPQPDPAPPSTERERVQTARLPDGWEGDDPVLAALQEMGDDEAVPAALLPALQRAIDAVWRRRQLPGGGQ